MTEEEKDWVRALLTQRVYDGEQKITRDNVSHITEYRTLAQAYQGTNGASPADVAWAWLAEEQMSNHGMVADDLERTSPGRGAAEIPRWHIFARARSGWHRERGITKEDLQEMRSADMVMIHLVQEETGMLWQEWERQEEVEVLRLSRGTVRNAWLKTKGRFKGDQGYRRFLKLVALQMMEGRVEGYMGEDPRTADWWEEAVETGRRVWGEETVAQEGDIRNSEKRPRALLAQGGRVVMIVVDWMAGTQSLRKAVEELGTVMYIGIDLQEWVYSHTMGGWVQNLKADLLELTPVMLWQLVCAEVFKRIGEEVEVQVLLLAMSPCCKTFSKADSSNTSRGHNYRLHGPAHPDRPPKDDTSDKGIEAIKADEMVMHGIELAIWLVNAQPIPGQGTAIYMENPVGSLWRRPYMEDWEATGMVKRFEVHYCAYDHVYHKPTHIWTTMAKWKPMGATGTGQCDRRCKSGQIQVGTGYWVHKYKIAQASHQAKGGAGRKAFKNMMPAKLHMELLKEALRLNKL